MAKKWVDCSVDEKLEAIRTDIDELYKRVQNGSHFQQELASGLLEVRKKLNLEGFAPPI